LMTKFKQLVTPFVILGLVDLIFRTEFYNFNVPG